MQSFIKFFEVRDRMTFIPIMCIDTSQLHTSDQRRYLLQSVGYHSTATDQIILVELNGYSIASCDPYSHGNSNRTLTTAHTFIIEHWNELEDGQVIDVEFILNESESPKQSQRLEHF
jgi:hypothetical protein